MIHTRSSTSSYPFGEFARSLGLARRAVLPLVFGAFVACGGGDDGTGPGGNGDEEGAVGPAGGTVSIQEAGVTVTVPAGAVSTDVTLEASATTDVPSDDDFVGGSGVEMGPDGQQFATPVTLQIGYSESSLPAGVPESDLRLGTVEGGQWQVISGSTVNASSNTVSGSVSHFSVFGAVALSVDAVSVDLPTSTISVDESVTLQVTATAADGTVLGRSATYSSNAEGVASVSSSGVVTGQSGGTAVITVTVGGVSTDVTIEVLPPVASVEVQPTQATVQAGSTVTLTATAKDASGEELDRTFSYSSDNQSVASVSSSGVVTGEGRGTATITVTAGGVSAQVQITVTDPVVAVGVTPNQATVAIGSTQELTVVVFGQSGNQLDGVEVTFSSDAESVATVDENGLVTAVASGEATITVTAEGVTATATITVPLNVADLVGSWSGQWNNLTFDSQGDAHFIINVDQEAGDFSVVVDMDGNVFGGDDPEPQSFTGMLSQGGITFSGTTETYGDYSVTGTLGGEISGELTDIPAGGINSASFSGTITPTDIDLTYTIVFSGGAEAQGTIQLEKDENTSGLEIRTVSVTENVFTPQTLTIPVGSAVVWSHDGSVLHNIVPDGHAAWADHEFPPGSNDFAVIFDSAGSFPYVCEYHVGMMGTISVE